MYKAISLLFELVLFLKLNHWITASYAQHKATDDAIETLGKLQDRFVEIYLDSPEAKAKLLKEYRATFNVRPLSDKQVVVLITKARDEFTKLKIDDNRRDVTNIIDDIIEALSHTLYLLTLH
jgi:hypothetical protein